MRDTFRDMKLFVCLLVTMAVFFIALKVDAVEGHADQDIEQPWDEAFAREMVKLLNHAVLPGLKRIVHDPRLGWTVELDALKGLMVCESKEKTAFECKRSWKHRGGPYHKQKPLPGLARVVASFVSHLKIPSSRYIELRRSSMDQELTLLYLTQQEGESWSKRILGAWYYSAWFVTEPIPISTDSSYSDEVSVSSRPIYLGDAFLLVIGSSSSEGLRHGGSSAYRAIVVIPDGEVAITTDSMDLGSGWWHPHHPGETVEQMKRPDGGANLLCPHQTPGGFILKEACPSGLQKIWMGFTDMCAIPCKKGGKLTDRTGLYLVRQGVIQKAKRNSIRLPRKNDLLIVEVPKPESEYEDFVYLELENKSRSVLDISGTVITTIHSDGYETGTSTIRDEPACVVNAGEMIAIADQHHFDDLNAPRGTLCIADSEGYLNYAKPIELRSRMQFTDDGQKLGILLAQVRVNFPDGDLALAEESQLAWTVDSHRRACFQPTSPGIVNPSCPRKKGNGSK